MKEDIIIELDCRIEKFILDNSEINTWIMLKESEKNLRQILQNSNLRKANDKYEKELTETEDCIKFMKRNFSAVNTYEELILKRQTLQEVAVYH